MRKRSGKAKRKVQVKRTRRGVVVLPARQGRRADRTIATAPAVPPVAPPAGVVDLVARALARTMHTGIASARAAVGMDERGRLTVPVNAIDIGQRHRKDYGDLRALAASIDERGALLQPIVVSPKLLLIAGERRIRAWHLCRFKDQGIPITVVDVDSIVLGERDENFQRKAFTLSEAVAIKREAEPIEKARALVRQREGQAVQGDDKGRAGDKVAAFVGIGRQKLERAEKVVEAAEKNPKKYGPLLEQMDRTGNVNGPFKRLTNLQQVEKLKKSPPALPGGPYSTHVFDVPWASEPDGPSPSETGRGYFNYPTMNTAELIAFGDKVVPTLDPAGGHIWFWTTNFHLLERHAFKVLDAWSAKAEAAGVGPIAIIGKRTWVKDVMGRGQVFRGQTEDVILCKFGKSPPALAEVLSTRLDGDVRADSEKPEQFYRDVERATPAKRYCEWFARRKLPENWDGFGDQVGTLPAPPATLIGEKLTAAQAKARAKLGQTIDRMLGAKAKWNGHDVATLADKHGCEPLLDALAAAVDLAQADYRRAGAAGQFAEAVAAAAKSKAKLVAAAIKGRAAAKVEVREAAARSQDAVIARADAIGAAADARRRALMAAAVAAAGFKSDDTVRYRGKLHDGRTNQWLTNPTGTVHFDPETDIALRMHVAGTGGITFFAPDELHKLERVEPTNATNTYLAELGAPDPGKYRETPAGQNTVPELVKPGAIVVTNYDSGPYRVVEVAGPWKYPERKSKKQPKQFDHYSLCLCRPDAKPKKDGTYTADAWINEVVAVDGRLLHLFEGNDDEVFFGATIAEARAAKQAAKAAARAAKAKPVRRTKPGRDGELIAFAESHGHTVGMTRDGDHDVGACACGVVFRFPVADRHKQLDAAITAHWQEARLSFLLDGIHPTRLVGGDMVRVSADHRVGAAFLTAEERAACKAPWLGDDVPAPPEAEAAAEPPRRFAFEAPRQAAAAAAVAADQAEPTLPGIPPASPPAIEPAAPAPEPLAVRKAIDAKVRATPDFDEVRDSTHGALYEAFNLISREAGAGSGYACYRVPALFVARLEESNAAIAGLSTDETRDLAGTGDAAAGAAIAARSPELARAQELLGAFARGWWKSDAEPPTGKVDDDQLDIPVFLRRESNDDKAVRA